jgi:tRNA nucleotidyltransferase (CCA-adding enzyme)
VRLDAPLRKLLGPLARDARGLGLRLYAVGGCVRDGLLGRVTRDLDLVTEADPRPLAAVCVRRWGGAVEEFDRFGTVRLRLPGARVDIAGARAETYAHPAALPEVRPAKLEEDLGRRDFTVNAMARELAPEGAGALIDPFRGVKDLKARALRVLHPLSFRDDPTRLFRGARYAGRLGLRPDPAAAKLLEEAVRERWPALLSRERVRQELCRILEEKDSGPAMGLLKRWKLLRCFHPDFKWPASAGKSSDAMVRLGVCALAMRPGKGLELVRSLPLDHACGQVLELALFTAKEKAAPRSKLPEVARQALALHLPRLPKKALEPLLVGGEDLKKLGLPPGKEYSRLLSLAARAQWAGNFKDRSGALKWLKKAASGAGSRPAR